MEGGETGEREMTKATWQPRHRKSTLKDVWQANPKPLKAF